VPSSHNIHKGNFSPLLCRGIGTFGQYYSSPRLFCLNQPRILTRFQGSSLILSKSYRLSDTFTALLSHFVQIISASDTFTALLPQFRPDYKHTKRKGPNKRTLSPLNLILFLHPFSMEDAFFINTLIRMSSEIVTLCLN